MELMWPSKRAEARVKLELMALQLKEIEAAPVRERLAFSHHAQSSSVSHIALGAAMAHHRRAMSQAEVKAAKAVA